MNTRQKGRKAELEYKQILIKRGFKEENIELVKGSSKFNQQVDIFGFFDLIALNPNYLLCVQVKCNSTSGSILQLREWRSRHADYCYVRLLVAVRMDGSGGKPAVWREIEVG